MSNANNTEVIIVGAGPAGLICAITLAKKGIKVVVIERGLFAGSKNVFGGAIYTNTVKEFFPDFEKEAPLERKTIEHNYMILGESDSTTISYRNNENSSYSVIRAKFDRWIADEARKLGVVIVEETVVREVIVKDDKVVGVKTELEEFYSNVVVLADGVNSLLAKQLKMRKNYSPKDVALSIKEVIKLDKDLINKRFRVNDSEGTITQIFGGPMLEKVGLGFMYTNSDSITIGLGLRIDELVKSNYRPFEFLQQLKEHPSIAPLIEGGELKEYSAHMIPEGGYKKIPQLCGDGVIVVGDAAMLVNSLHWEGTNLAMVSGKLAAETIVIAKEKNDYSKKSLRYYEKLLKDSFVMKDMQTYRELFDIIDKRKNSFLGFYLLKINEFFNMFTSVNGIPKRHLYWNFIKNIFKFRSLSELFKDIVNIIKLVWSILI